MPHDSKTTSPTKTGRPGKIIAVGGAKGGIGKSLFVANLGVFLSRLGKRTVVVDLDLGGANLHLYMGVWSLTCRIDDFLDGTVSDINEIGTPTKYGPLLIGGGGGKLGAANIHFSRKLKLLRALKTIDADYVILDLGGDTTYNILDFYLAADQGFVLTTCDPASYMDAYGFIKTSLHRKLTRLFGAESNYYDYRDATVDQLINDHIFPHTTGNGSHIQALMDRLEAEKPIYHGIVKGLLDGFRPGVVVTMFDEQEQADELVARLQKISRKMLSVDLNYFGCVPFEKEIQRSAKELIPSVAKNPEGSFAKALRRIVLKMEMA
ncbi:ATP-binding protein [Desulfosarcina ovata subsp. sediminis]|uniref:ATP-binding protein n=1 Tax=Desulfosarcina ovata subsp. sediminis TaxID=885957 RepID=A0A5K7ZL51_9BACT|nr:P-loop NTPase [Desulfosarcina ovata]BBO81776.1 ATP-binding protein [Desulfosarcina ovata subsp. sediminis]